MVKGLCMRREQKRNEMEKDESCGHCDGRILRRTRTCRERHKHDTPPRKTAHGAQQTAPQVPARHPVQFPARSPRPNRSNWLILLVLVSTTSGVVFCKGEWEWATPVCERGSEAVAVEKCETRRPTAPDQNGTRRRHVAMSEGVCHVGTTQDTHQCLVLERLCLVGLSARGPR